MRLMANMRPRSAPGSIMRSPWMGAAVTAILAVTFWMGMVWLAGRIMS